VSALVTEVWPGVVVGSGRVERPRDVMRDFSLDVAFILSRSTFDDLWYGVPGAIPLFIDDGRPHSHGEIARLIRALSMHESEGLRVGFFCFAGVNRSAAAACLWRWWCTGQHPGEAAKELLKLRPQSFQYRWWLDLLATWYDPMVRGDAAGTSA